MSTAPIESRSGQVVAIVAAVQALSTIFLALRFYTRLRIQRMGLGADDWIIIAAWLLTLTYGTDISLQTKFGLGKHLIDLPRETDFTTSNILFYAKQPVYYISVSLTKVSIIFFYFRLFPQVNYRMFLWFMMTFVLLTGFTSSVAGIFQCHPIHRAWDTSVPGTCFDLRALFCANAGLNIFQDFVIYLLPSPILWNIQLPVKQRIALVGIFVVGGFVCITGIVRVATLWDAIYSDDPTWYHFDAAVWSAIESNFGIVCASLVHFKPLIAKIAPSILGTPRSPKHGKMVKLKDNPGNPENANRITFGQYQGNKPVDSLTGTEVEEDICKD
ncbi:hypothetical protein GL218_09018 [Daldinia childiae]|uniref:uncharacterized protein n=1 Tax=Daldinia childiae TaxID=326645 RepID=UPI0014451DA8|nr:uncharacterized protein GL218_09018 [Daldinia childiae]KAF3066552.1 hypothetical protein GL218_09018 [Daldinia childiae]